YNLGLLYHHGLGVESKISEAAKWYGRAAENGDADGQKAIGDLYAKGFWGKKNSAKAATWYRKAAEQGHAGAKEALRKLGDKGQGGPRQAARSDAPTEFKKGQAAYKRRDYAEAARRFRNAAEQGYLRAQAGLGSLYEKGRGVPQDYTEALKWYRKAAEGGYVYAQANLGYMYARGRGVPRSSAEAARWYRKAARQGYAWAQRNLGHMYYSGRGVPRDYVRAHLWYNLAASRQRPGKRREKAIQNRIKAEEAMTPAEIAGARRLARAVEDHREAHGRYPDDAVIQAKMRELNLLATEASAREVPESASIQAGAAAPIESAMAPAVGKAPPGFEFTTPPVPAPNIRFTDSTGNALSLADFRGKVVLLNIWATWCPPCVYELPSLDRLQKKLGKLGFEVVAVSQDQGGAPLVEKFFKRLGLRHLRQYLDPGRHARARFGTTTLPTSILIDANGNERGRMVQAADWDSSAAISLIRQIRQTPAAAPIESAMAPAVDGVYGSNRGKVTLSQSGSQISGTYACCGGGKITGTRSGNKIDYSWIQSSGSGKGVLTVSEDGIALNGTWGMGESATGGGSWNLILKAYWTKDANGCAVWNDNPRTNKAVTWSGPCVNGKAHGKGIVQFFKAGKPNGDRYVGDYRNGKAHGWGDHTWPNGDRYVGDYRNDKRHGRGVYTFSSGNRYEGEFRHSSRHGQGVFTMANGDRHEGEFRHRLWNGTFTSRDGRQRKIVDGKRVD
ncbi:MAG: redoxin family protein, partial [Alphaproteobacteria bacterium]|nr:redoxin family protein [Alphaproteobacteria bacterium]